MWGGCVVVTEAGSYLRLIDSCITQLKAQGPSRTCNESKEEDAEKQRGKTAPKGTWRTRYCTFSHFRKWAGGNTDTYIQGLMRPPGGHTTVMQAPMRHVACGPHI